MLKKKLLTSKYIFHTIMAAWLALLPLTSVFGATGHVRYELIQASNIDSSGEYTFEKCRPLQRKPFDPANPKKKALVIGDSQACDFINSVMENGYLRDYQISLRNIPYRCQPVTDKLSKRVIAPQDQPFCSRPEHADSLDLAMKQIQQADLIIFAARWKPEAAKVFPQTLEQLNLRPGQKVVVLGSKNFGKISIRQYLHMTNSELRQLRNEVTPVTRKVNTILRKKLSRKPVTFVDQHRLVCGKSETCPVFTDDLKLISYDGRHLTRDGAVYIGKVLFNRSSLGKL